MIVVSTKKIVGDDRDFCASWKAVPSHKFLHSNLTVCEYPYPDNIIPDDFWKKHCIYYVDHDNQNRLVKAFELEDMWDKMEFLDTDVLAESGALSQDAVLQYTQGVLNNLIDRVTALEQQWESVDFDNIFARLKSLEENVIYERDNVAIRQQD